MYFCFRDSCVLPATAPLAQVLLSTAASFAHVLLSAAAAALLAHVLLSAATAQTDDALGLLHVLSYVPLKLRTVHLSDNTIIYEKKFSVKNIFP
jgi:hypothetical protein